MCGIAGILTGERIDEQSVARLIRPLAHRGPDDDGIWVDADAGVGLGHRRLAIVDLSPAGHQPMVSATGRFVLTFNGEIYNHPELKDALELDGAVPEGGWRGHSDTELFLEGIATWGLEETLERSAGMFAFALWDRKMRTLSLVRDRFGEKPLYYGWVGKDFLFGSELKALRAHPGFDNAIDDRAVALFTKSTVVPAPLTIYERIFKLPPASILTLTPEVAREGGPLRPTPYWSYRDVVERGLSKPIDDEEEARGQLELLLAQAIAGQSMADVPVGAFLSGGIDSATVCAIYQKYSGVPIRTFSIGFEEAGFDESPFARRVAEHLGTIHSEHYVTVREAREVIPLLPAIYDEPFADSSQIPTHLVSRYARQQVTVALTGDGGDELFGGYRRHFLAPRLWQGLKKVPRPLRAVAGKPLAALPYVGGKLRKGLALAGAGSFDDVSNVFYDMWYPEDSPAIVGDAAVSSNVAIDAPDAVRIMYRDAVGYLPDDILTKVDRASMAASLETRVPFLDHRVAEFAARVPLDLKVRNGRGKHIVRELLYGLVPREMLDRGKAGFALPVGDWIKDSLRPWAEDLLPRTDDYFDAAIVRRRWRDHVSGRRNYTEGLWAVLMFQAWLREQGVAGARAA
jgi:asparagine synthase (glutamine-hydrolysing)